LVEKINLRLRVSVQFLKNGHQVSWSTVLLKSVHIPITKRMLNTAEPTIVPIPTSVDTVIFILRMHVTYKVYDWLKNYFFCALRVVTNSLIG
jgi:hypothetical protein